MCKIVYAVESKVRGSKLWFTVVLETTPQAARSELRRIREAMRLMKSPGTFRVGEYRKQKGKWARVEPSQNREEQGSLPHTAPELPRQRLTASAEGLSGRVGHSGHVSLKKGAGK